MSDSSLRDLERELAQTGAPANRISLADKYHRIGNFVRAAQTIMPLAFEPEAETTIRQLAGGRPNQYADAVDLLAAKTFDKTGNLDVRLAYLSQRITCPDARRVICNLVTACAQNCMRADFIPHNTHVELHITPLLAEEVIVENGGYFHSENLTRESIIEAYPTFALLLHARERLLAAGYAPVHALDLSRIDMPARTIDGLPITCSIYSTFLRREKRGVNLTVSPNHTNDYSSTQADGPHSLIDEPWPITLLGKGGAR